MCVHTCLYVCICVHVCTRAGFTVFTNFHGSGMNCKYGENLFNVKINTLWYIHEADEYRARQS